MINLLETSKSYALACHQDTHHLYDNQPYQVHLEMVEAVALNFIHLIPEADREVVLAGCWVHDVIEDCRQTYNDVKTATSEAIAELAYALTNEKGKNRAERANDKYYQGIRETPYAIFVKLCDRIANVQYSQQKNSRMVAVYQQENANFCQKMYAAQYLEMFIYLEKSLNIGC
ncbi:MAG: phosphohydrolase [Microscillaceae bacterium]|jgi:(p)ppGpp synthase/HD superfamily hydrolase|nr:phosphohydrolase [Microscillaceae bacterium]